MPKARKGERPFVPSVHTLLRDANPTWFEIDGEPDPIKRAKNERARDFATAELMKLYRRALKSGKPWRIEPRVFYFCERITNEEPERAAKAMRARTGAPDQRSRRLSIAVDVEREVLGAPKGRGALARAIASVAARRKCSLAAVRKIYLQGDPEWKEAITVSLELQNLGRPPPSAEP